MSEANGAVLPSIDVAEETPAEKAAAPPTTAVDKARAVIDAQIRQVVGVTVRGLLVSAPGVPPLELLNCIARVTGGLCAAAVEADVGTTLTVRNGFEKAFSEGVRSAPLFKAPTPRNQPPRRG